MELMCQDSSRKRRKLHRGSLHASGKNDVEVWRQMAQNLQTPGGLNQSALKIVGAMSTDGIL